MAQKPCEISKFKGVNRIVDASKLEPGEMTTLQGALINTGSLCNMPMPSYDTADVTFPIPVVIENESGYSRGSWNPLLATNYTSFAGAVNTRIALLSLATIPTNQPVTVFFLMKGTITSALPYMTVSVLDAVGPNPSTDRTLYRLNSFTLNSSDPTRVWRGFTIVVDSAAVNPKWVVLDIFGAVGASFDLYGHPTHTQDVQEYSGGTWQSWGTLHPGQSKPQFVVVSQGTQVSTATDSARLVSQMGEVNLPFNTWQGGVQCFATNQSFTTGSFTAWGGASLSVIEIPKATGTYKRSLIMNSDTNGGVLSGPLTGTSLYANVIPKVNLVRVGNVIAATAPGVQYCIPITLMDTPYRAFDTDFHAVSFQNYLALCGGGTDGLAYGSTGVNKKPVYLDLTLTGNPIHSGYAGICVKSYAAALTPDEPMFVLNFGESLIYVRNRDYPYRMWYGTAGTVDTFNAYENLSQAEPVLNVAKYGTEFLAFFSNQVKKYSGVPRYAVLAPIKETGVKNGRFIVRANGGLYVLCSDGLFFYNGVFNPVLDKAQIFETNHRRYTGQASNYDIHQTRLAHLEKQHAIAIVLQRSHMDSAVYKDTDIWFYDYWTSDFYQYWLNDYDAQCGVYQMAAVPYDVPWLLDYQYTPNYSGLMCESSTAFSPMNVETGWIDPLPVMDKKHFLHFTMEATNTVASLLISLTVTYDNGLSYTWSDIDLHTAADSEGRTPTYTKIEKQVPAHAGRFKVAITCNAIIASTPTTEQIKIHKFTLWWDDGKPK